MRGYLARVHGIVANRRRVGRWAALAALTLATAALSAGCGGSSSSSTKGSTTNVPKVSGYVKGGTATVRLEADYDTLNPALSATIYGDEIDNFVYDRLLSSTATGKLVPYLATSWSTTPNSVTLHLRNNATCSDGTKMTPSVVAKSLKYLYSTGSFPATVTFGGNVPTFTADDAAGTLKITLNHPYPETLTALASPYDSIICPAGLAHPAKLENQAFGSGPYVISKSQRGSQYTLTLRSNYAWGPNGETASQPGVPSTVILKVITDETTAANLLQNGQLTAGYVHGRDIDRLQGDSSLFHVTSQEPGANAIIVNEAKGLPGADPEVRKALSLAINTKDLNQAENFGHAALASTIYNQQMACYDPSNGQYSAGYNPQQAKQLLASDGYKPGPGGKLEKNGNTLTIRVLGVDSQNFGPDYIGTALDAIGVNTKVQQVTGSQYANITFSTGAWDLQDYIYGAAVTSPAVIGVQVSGPAPPKGDNPSAIDNPDANAAIATANHAPSRDAACTAWDAAEKAILQRVDAKPSEQLTFDWFGNKAQFAIVFGQDIDPMSLRLTH
jgi:peptide/nickel transport system substrate-binding protein